MTEQVERIGIRLTGSFCQVVEIDAPLGETLNDLGSLLRVSPLCSKLRRGAIERADFLRCVVGELDHTQLFPIRIEFMDDVRHNLDLTSVKVVLAAPAFCVIQDLKFSLLFCDHRLFFDNLVCLWLPCFGYFLLSNEDRISIEVRVSK